MIEERYAKTLGALTEDEITALHTRRVCVVGCGGLGGYAAEMLARTGVLNISVIDGDIFSQSNLNRQLLCTGETIGALKADCTARRVREINPAVTVRAHTVFLNEENAAELLRDHDAIIDALDNVPSRLLLEQYAETLNIPLIHGAVREWFAQIAVIMPGDRILGKLYNTSTPPSPSVPPFTPALCAALQVSETIKLLCGRESPARGKLLFFDLTENTVNNFIV